MTLINAYIGRGNDVHIGLIKKKRGASGFSPVDDNVVTRVMLRFGPYCMDTDVAEDPIEFNATNTEITLKPGLVPDLAAGRYAGNITVYDALYTEGIAWAEVIIRAIAWPVCAAQ